MIELLNPRLWLAALILVAFAYTAGRWQQHHLDAIEHKADMVEALQQSSARYEAIVKSHSETAHEAAKTAEIARMDARDARATAERLRQRIAQIAAGNAAPAAGGTPAGDAVNMLTDVLERADQRMAELAEYADSARIAGQACEASYDSLTPK